MAKTIKMIRKTTSITKGRSRWTAEYSVQNGRAIGVLRYSDRVVREKFSVSVKPDGTFSVDIGTGSGVKVAFRHD